jgi:hypothetical protein
MGDDGLFLYAHTPESLKSNFIGVFRRNPKAVLGLTKAHLIVHSIKVLDKYDLTALIVPFAGVALGLNLLPEYLLWAIFIGSSGYLCFSVISKTNAPLCHAHYKEPAHRG